jgi:uncharacterized membrane protein
VYAFWLFVHLGGLLLFVAGHGISAATGLRLRREREPARMSALLDASASARGATYAGMLLLAVGGFADATIGHFWSTGWVWTSIAVFLGMSAVLVVLAIPYYRRLRAAVAAADRDEIERLSASPVPVAILAIGVGGLAFILWLMVVKPF